MAKCYLLFTPKQYKLQFSFTKIVICTFIYLIVVAIIIVLLLFGKLVKDKKSLFAVTAIEEK